MTGFVDDDNGHLGTDRPADVFVAALLEAGPEAAEHLLKAAQELLLAAKAVVDAGERALDAHRSSEAATDADDPAADERESSTRASGVRRIDLA
jgi:hypothetical protein